MHCHLFIFTLLTLTLLQVVHAANLLNRGVKHPKDPAHDVAVADHDAASQIHSDSNQIHSDPDQIHSDSQIHFDPNRRPTPNMALERSKRVRRGARVSSSQDFRWPDGIVPYTMSSEFTEKESHTIRRAMDYISCMSCVQFVERTTHEDFVSILTNNNGKCSSNIGREGGQQELVLGNGCVNWETVLHELMHTLGFWHEHNRPDRARYVDIYWNNIKPEERFNFEKIPSANIDTQGLSYDYFSIMHYNEDAGSRNNRDTILSREWHRGLFGGWAKNAGRRGLTPTDHVRIN